MPGRPPPACPPLTFGMAPAGARHGLGATPAWPRRRACHGLGDQEVCVRGSVEGDGYLLITGETGRGRECRGVGVGVGLRRVLFPGVRGRSSMAELQSSKLTVRVRFPSPAPHPLDPGHGSAPFLPSHPRELAGCRLVLGCRQPAPVPTGEAERRPVVVMQRPETTALGDVVRPHVPPRRTADDERLPQRAAEMAQVQQTDRVLRRVDDLLVPLPVGVLRGGERLLRVVVVLVGFGGRPSAGLNASTWAKGRPSAASVVRSAPSPSHCHRPSRRRTGNSP